MTQEGSVEQAVERLEEALATPFGVFDGDEVAAAIRTVLTALNTRPSSPDLVAVEAVARRLYDFDREHLRHHRSNRRIMPAWEDALPESRHLYLQRAAIFPAPSPSPSEEKGVSRDHDPATCLGDNSTLRSEANAGACADLKAALQQIVQLRRKTILRSHLGDTAIAIAEAALIKTEGR